MKNSRYQEANGINGEELRYTDAGSGNAVILLRAARKSELADRLAQLATNPKGKCRTWWPAHH